MILSVMLPPTCIVVPTYWTRAGGAPEPGDAVYDHPTALGGPNTLERLLTSLEQLNTSQFYLLVLVAVTADELAVDAEREVQRLVGRYSSIRTLTFGPSALRSLHEWLADQRFDDARAYLDLREYPKIRNLQLAVPVILRSKAIVALDDDEIVTDNEFLQKATVSLGLTVEGVRVDGLSGHYEQEDGSILLKTDPAKAGSRNLFDRKAAIMNEATHMIEDEPGDLVRTPFCFGGNMEFSMELARSVGFDPGITRGEDIDYLINARMEGKEFFLRKNLHILHRPPPGGSYMDSSTSKLEQDVIRFLYERAKLRASLDHPALHPVSAETLMPYPGRFLEGDLETDARAALDTAGYAGNSKEFVEGVLAGLDDRLQKYFQFRERWPLVTEAMSEATEMRERLLSRVQNV